MKNRIYNNKNIVFLWIGHIVSHAGDAVYMIALPWLMLEMTGSKSLSALVSMSAFLPTLLFGLLAGSLVDRYHRKTIMIISDLLRAITVIIIPISLIYGIASPLLIGILTFFMATFGTPFYPARDSLIPHLTTKDELPAANAAMSVSGQLSHLLGPLFAGIGILLFGLTHLFTADAISFLFSILMISLIKTSKSNTQLGQRTHRSIITEGLGYLKKRKGLSILILTTVINNIFIMGPAIIGLPVFVREILKSDFQLLAILETSMAGGMILGSFIFWKAIKKYKPIDILIIGLILDGITYSLLFLVNSEFPAIIVLFIHGIGIPLITVSRTTMIQRSVSDLFRGRIFSMVNMSVVGTTALSIGITGFLLEFISANVLFLFIGLLGSLCFLIPFLSRSIKLEFK